MTARRPNPDIEGDATERKERVISVIRWSIILRLF